MCLLIVSKDGKLPSADSLENAWSNNSDGFGICWVRDGKLHISKTLNKKNVKRILKKAEGFPYVAHWRFATHGSEDISNVHPFQFCGNYALAHNGIINNVTIVDKSKSDTRHFVDYWIKPLVEAGVDILGFKSAIEGFVGNGNKVAIIKADGSYIIANEKLGKWDNGIWYSNDSHTYQTIRFDGYDDFDYISEMLRQKYGRKSMTVDYGYDARQWDRRWNDEDSSICISRCDACLATDVIIVGDVEGMELCRDCYSYYKKETTPEVGVYD